jgi:uncharacterized lipoprotein YmbA
MKWTLTAASIVLTAFAAGCASTPVRYLTLDMNSSGSNTETGHVVVDAVELSDALRRPELLVQADQTEIEYYSDAHWVSSLTELVTEKLAAEFGTARAAQNPSRLRIKVWHFGEDETVDPHCGRVKLSASAWAAESSLRDDPVWSDVYEECTPIEGDDVSDVAAALSTGLEVIALQIAEDLDRLNP